MTEVWDGPIPLLVLFLTICNFVLLLKLTLFSGACIHEVDVLNRPGIIPDTIATGVIHSSNKPGTTSKLRI